MRGIGLVRAMFGLALVACCAGRATAQVAERINQEGRILGPVPVVTTPVLFNTPAADTIISAMQVYPVTSAWNEDVSKLPLLSNSAAMIAKINSDLVSSRRTLRMFSEMNYILVPDAESKQDILFFNYPDESDDLKPGSQDTGTYPIDANLPIEGWPIATGALTLAQWQQDINNDGGDRHSITVMPGTGFVWETWLTQAFPGQTPPWQASNGAKFDLNTNTLRPDGFTSGDAAGLSMFGALVRYDECERGMVEHAVRLVVKTSRKEHIYPATHDAGSTTDANTPAMGQRIRLNAGFAIPANWTQEEKAVALALKKYGGIVADNGGFFSISYCPDDRFPANCFDNLSTIPVLSFEVVQSTVEGGGPRSATPIIVNAGMDQTVTLSAGATLSGSVTGGTNPTIQWYAYPYAPQPGTVNFSNASAAGTTATFSAPGTYILMLSGDDGVHAKTFDAVNITVTNTMANPAPTLTTVAPATAKTGAAGFLLTLTGTNFNSASVVNWPGKPDLAPASVTATTITVNVPAAYIAAAGSVAVTVTNPTPGGGASASKTFSVTNPAPTLASISPATAAINGAAFTLTLNGTNFIAGSVVNWAGQADLIPASVTGTQITVNVPAAYVAAVGSTGITVVNPAPGGGASSSIAFAIVNTTGAFLSGPMVDNSNPNVGDTVHFSATPPGTSTFAFTWNFGDGTSDTSGGSAAHAYATAGSYTVQVVAIDPLGNSVQGSLTVTVMDATSTLPIPMTISKFAAAIKAKAPGGDTCSFSGTLPNLPTPFSPAGPVVLNINGVVASLTLDARGHQTGVNSFAFKLKALPRIHGVKTTGYQGGNIPFKVTLRKRNFASAWSIPATGGKGVPIPLKIDIQYGGSTYEDNITPLYKGAAGKNGTLKK